MTMQQNQEGEFIYTRKHQYHKTNKYLTVYKINYIKSKPCIKYIAFVLYSADSQSHKMCPLLLMVLQKNNTATTTSLNWELIKAALINSFILEEAILYSFWGLWFWTPTKQINTTDWTVKSVVFRKLWLKPSLFLLFSALSQNSLCQLLLPLSFIPSTLGCTHNPFTDTK